MDDSIIARQVLVAEGDPKCAISYLGLYRAADVKKLLAQLHS